MAGCEAKIGCLLAPVAGRAGEICRLHAPVPRLHRERMKARENEEGWKVTGREGKGYREK